MSATEQLRDQKKKLGTHLDRLQQLFQRLETATAHQKELLAKRSGRKNEGPP